MDVGITVLRGDLSRWVARARDGEEVVITDHGTPVARLLAVESTPLIEQLVERGVLGKPTGHERPRARGVRRARATGPVSELVSDDRR